MKSSPATALSKNSNTYPSEKGVNGKISFCIFLFHTAPDGKEVELPLTGGGELEVEHSPDAPVSPTCDPNCSCVCHLEYPGMKLVWVPVDVEDGEDDDDIYEFEVDWEEEEEERSPPTHPIPPLNEDEDIYELTLPAINPTPKNTTAPTRPLCQELDIPLIRVRKPVRRAKMSSSTSDPTSEFQTDPDPISCVDDVPPPLPIFPYLCKRSDFDLSVTSFLSEPLYQTYRATVITKEIRRTGMSNGAPRSSPVPQPGQSTLWQDLPAVRDSGVLDQLSPDDCKYQESMFEVLTSEASYLRSLRVLTEHFLESRDLEETLIIRDRKTLFSNILRVREVSERFLKDLEDRMDESLVFSDICDIIHYHAQHNFPAYIDYVRNQIYQEKTYTALMRNNAQFAAVITRLQESPQCQRLPFVSFLLLPFQRITRIKMLIENILKRTKEGTKEEQTASKALDSVSKIIEECNTQVGKMKQVEELIHLSKTLEFDKLKAVPIISQSRYLEKKGELQEMSKGGTLFNMRAKFNSVHLFLFNDLLIIAAKKGGERFVVLDHAHRSLVQVQPLEEGASPYEHCFNLTMLENHQGRMMERLLKAPSQSDMHRWIAAFPSPANPDKEEDEVIYEDWGKNTQTHKCCTWIHVECM
uniref:Rho guanine nucleotide exchange factor 15b n=1 Tax=Myripristis murdjan TaxID=586833 RepID=A0A667Z6M2_9TELE